jgi:hypothetical protein
MRKESLATLGAISRSLLNRGQPRYQRKRPTVPAITLFESYRRIEVRLLQDAVCGLSSLRRPTVLRQPLPGPLIPCSE